jgi:hypothetical protein
MGQSKTAHCIYMVMQEWIPAFAGMTEGGGAYAMMQGWIPAFAEERHSHYREMLVRSTPCIGKKCSGGNDGGRGKDRVPPE